MRSAVLAWKMKKRQSMYYPNTQQWWESGTHYSTPLRDRIWWEKSKKILWPQQIHSRAGSLSRSTHVNLILAYCWTVCDLSFFERNFYGISRTYFNYPSLEVLARVEKSVAYASLHNQTKKRSSQNYLSVPYRTFDINLGLMLLWCTNRIKYSVYWLTFMSELRRIICDNS